MLYKKDYLLTEGNKIDELSKLYIKEGLPTYKIIKDGGILPRKVLRNSPYQGSGGVIDKDGKFVDESAVYDLLENDNKRIKLAFGGAYDCNSWNFSDNKVIYLGFAHQHWGHFLLDVVQRLWFCLANGLTQSEKYTYVFAGFGDGTKKWGRNYQEFFRLFGLKEEDIKIINQPTKFKEIIVPDIAVFPGEYFYNVYCEIFDRVSKQAMNEINLPIKDKIYFSRSHLKDLKELGENEIESAMRKSGFEVLYPEELSLGEQIFYWQTADKIACISGTIPHNCVFASKNLDLFIFSKTSNLVGYQFTMDAVWGKSPIYISTYKEPFKMFPISVSRGPFWIFPTDMFEKFINDYFSKDITYTSSSLSNTFKYFLLCAIVMFKYTFRGSRSRIKTILRNLFKFIKRET